MFNLFKRYSADAIQEGGLGLIEAANRFNPDLNVRFTTFAYKYIRDYMLNEMDFLLSNNNIVSLNCQKQDENLEYLDLIADENNVSPLTQMINEEIINEYYVFSNEYLTSNEKVAYEYMLKKNGNNCSYYKLGNMINVSKATAKRIYDLSNDKVKDHFVNFI